MTSGYIDIVFDGPPGPHPGGFVEVKDDAGASVLVGEWIKRDDSYWALRIPTRETVQESACFAASETGVIVKLIDNLACRAKLLEERIEELENGRVAFVIDPSGPGAEVSWVRLFEPRTLVTVDKDHAPEVDLPLRMPEYPATYPAGS